MIITVDKSEVLGIVRSAYIEIPDNEEFKLLKESLSNVEGKIVDLPAVYEDTELLNECFEAISYLTFLDNYNTKKYEKLFYKLKERLNIK